MDASDLQVTLHSFHSFVWPVITRIQTQDGDSLCKISVFMPNTRKYTLEKTPYSDTFHAMFPLNISYKCEQMHKEKIYLFTESEKLPVK